MQTNISQLLFPQSPSDNHYILATNKYNGTMQMLINQNISKSTMDPGVAFSNQMQKIHKKWVNFYVLFLFDIIHASIPFWEPHNQVTQPFFKSSNLAHWGCPSHKLKGRAHRQLAYQTYLPLIDTFLTGMTLPRIIISQSQATSPFLVQPLSTSHKSPQVV